MRKQFILLIPIIIVVMTGCNFGTQESIPPTPDTPVEETLVPQVEATNTPAPTATSEPTLTPQLPTLEPTFTPIPSTETPLPTETPEPTEVLGPWEHTIQPNDELIGIIQRYGYRTLDVIDEIVAMNSNIINADILPPVGEIILIPRPTAVPVTQQPEDTSIEATTAPSTGGIPDIPKRRNYTIPHGYQITPYQVKSGENIITIVERTSGLTLALFNQYNADISFAGCNFELPGGGPNCNPLVFEGQWVNILSPLPPPTATATPIGNETSTPTPTISAPIMVSPPNGGLASGTVRLSWVSTGLLQDQIYVVTVRNLTTGTVWTNGTSGLVMQLPNSLIPPSGETHQIEWNVAIGMRTETGDFYLTGGQGSPYYFNWRG
jgi:hypothetical protein